MALHTSHLKPFFFINCGLLAAAALWVRGCGSAEGQGGCKPVSGGGKYVASSFDTNGKPWTFKVSTGRTTMTCNSANGEGAVNFGNLDQTKQIIPITGVIRDSNGDAKGGLSVGALLIGEQPMLQHAILDEESGKYRAAAADDIFMTDSCGTVTFYFAWSCPPPLIDIGGTFTARSGSLFSDPIELKVENGYTPPTVVATVGVSSLQGTATPAPEAAPSPTSAPVPSQP